MLGAKCRQDLPAVLALLAEADPDNLLLEIDAGICILEGYDITMEDIEIQSGTRGLCGCNNL